MIAKQSVLTSTLTTRNLMGVTLPLSAPRNEIHVAGKALIKQGEKRRKDILKFVRSYTAKNGWAPTIQEIADAVGLVSPNATRTHLHKLVEGGYIQMQPRQARAIALVSPAPDGWTRKAS